MNTINKQFVGAKRRTSVRLEPELLSALQAIATRENTTASEWIRRVEAEADGRELSSAVRVAILEYWRKIVDDQRQPPA